MSLPSSTDASESKKKLQWARSRPECGRLPAVVVAKHQRRQPAVTNFLTHYGDRRVSPRNFLKGSSGYFASASMLHTLCSDPALPNSRELSNRGMLMPRMLLATKASGRKRVAEQCGIGEHHKVVKLVGVRHEELPRGCDDVKSRRSRELLADGEMSSRHRRLRRQVNRREVGRGAGRDRDDRRPDRRLT